MGLLALHALLTSDRLLATLAGARVRTGALAVYWQAASMTIATPALDVLESLDVLRDLASQRTLNDELRIDDRSDRSDLGFLEVVSTTFRIDPNLGCRCRRYGA